MPRDLPHVEQRGKKIVTELVAQRARRITRESRRNRRTKLVEDRHQVAGSLMTVDHRVDFAVQTAVNRVDDSVTSAELRLLDKRRRQDAFARGGEGDVYRIVHAARHDDVDPRVTGTATKNM